LSDPLEHQTDRLSGALTRRRLLLRGSSALGAFALGTYAAPVADALSIRAGQPAVNSFSSVPAAAPLRLHSRPDLQRPGLAVDVNKGGTAPGLIFAGPFPAGNAQAGALIADDTGKPVWERPVPGLELYNFQMQSYQGKPVLTWWQGKISAGHGIGSYVIADQAYQPIKEVQAGNGLQADLHEFLLTDRGTALLTAYAAARVDLRSVGGRENGLIQDAIFQEVEIATGRVLLEWRSLGHIPFAESYWPVSPWSWDYVHINSIDVDTDGQLLVSSRNTHTVYKIDRSSGEIIWRLGGKHNDFAMSAGASFAWQHDVRRQADGMLTIFDNQGAPNGAAQSRAIILEVDEQAKTARLVRQFFHPLALQASSMGSVQVLPNGNVFVGWGAEPFVSEFTPSGELIFDARFGAGYISYRAFRLPWSADGQGQPTIAAAAHGANATDLWVSWNGDTQVERWLVLGGSKAGALQSLATQPSAAFETAIQIDGAPKRLAVRGLDSRGRTLGESATLEL
jgi:outer membrane protein assembly factor BamB